MRTHDRRARWAPTSQPTERRLRELNVESGSGYVSLWNCSICCMAKRKHERSY